MPVNEPGFPWFKTYDAGVPCSLKYSEIPLSAFLEQAADRFPDQPCTIFQNHELTYRRMDNLTNRLAVALHEMGLQKGDRVALVLPNCPQFVLAFYAILKAGGVVVALNPSYKAAEMAFHLSDSGAGIVLILDNLLALLEKIRPQTAVRKIILTALDDAASLGSDFISPGQENPPVDHLLDLLIRYQGASLPKYFVQGANPAVFQYSGGTTGPPKAAIGLHRNLVANTIQFNTWLGGLQPGREVVLAAIPLFHVYGMVIAMSLGLSAGATLVLIPDSRDIPSILEGITFHQATLFPGVPNLYRLINHFPDITSPKYSLKSLKACICGSAPLLPEIKDKFESLTGAKLLEGYGLSEAPTATHCNPLKGQNRTGSIGLPLPDVECRIVDLQDPNKDLPPGQPGELLLRGPQIMAGYHNQPEESAAVLAGGWLHTGDVAVMDPDGYFYLIDRKKDLMKIGGLQVWPREVEEAILNHPAVLDAGVIGFQDPQYGETVKAWVVRRPGMDLESAEVIAWVRQHLADFKAPRQVEFVETLPRSGLGKLLRRELRLSHEQKKK